MFTQGQSNRMLAAVNSLAGNRSYLWQEANLIATGIDDETYYGTPHADCAPIPDFKSNTNVSCSGANVVFENFTYNYRDALVSYEWILKEALLLAQQILTQKFLIKIQDRTLSL